VEEDVGMLCSKALGTSFIANMHTVLYSLAISREKERLVRARGCDLVVVHVVYVLFIKYERPRLVVVT